MTEQLSGTPQQTAAGNRTAEATSFGPQRDGAQRLGDALFPPVAFLNRIGIGWIVLIAGWGISLPIVILRASWSLGLRVGLALLLFVMWVGVILADL